MEMAGPYVHVMLTRTMYGVCSVCSPRATRARLTIPLPSCGNVLNILRSPHAHISQRRPPSLAFALALSIVSLSSYTGTLTPLSSPMHSLYPADSSTLYISGADCVSCLYIPNDGSSLTMGTPYYVRVTAYNALGWSAVASGVDDTSGVATVTPNQVLDFCWHGTGLTY